MQRLLSAAVELRLPDFTGWAARRDSVYHLGTTPDALRQAYFRIASALDREPVPVPDLGVVVNGNVFREITHAFLYDDRLFPDLAETWRTLATGSTPSAVTVRPLAVQVPSDNRLAVLYAVTCNDVAWRRDVGFYAGRVAVDRLQYPVTAGMPANIWPCAFWPHHPIEPPVPVTDAGPRNVLILQNLRDPATPWVSGHGLRTALGRRAAFVTVDAGGHGIFPERSAPCTTAIATAFLAHGVLPTRDAFCVGPSPEDVVPKDAPAVGHERAITQVRS
jgi:hypothetical protein